MVKIIQDYISKSIRNRLGNYMKPFFITVHNTANTSKGADAASQVAFVKRSSTGVSWQYTVDDQHLPLNENGWHAGDGRGTVNMKSIGIEINIYRHMTIENGIVGTIKSLSLNG